MKCGKDEAETYKMTENKAIKEFSDYVRIIDKRRQMRRRNETEP